MTDAYLRRPWVDPAGRAHFEGERIELSERTPEERLTFDYLVSSGLVSRTAPSTAPNEAVAAVEADPDGS